jgi:hypothetical protein
VKLSTLHFGPGHPLAEVATRHCNHPAPLLGGVACGACWELAVRDDERLVVECGLPREIEPDPEYVDEIAVDLACRGERVELTPAEFRVAVRRLAARRLFPIEVARRLHCVYQAVVEVLESGAPAAGEAAAVASVGSGRAA